MISYIFGRQTITIVLSPQVLLEKALMGTIYFTPWEFPLAALMERDARYSRYMKIRVRRNETRQEGYNKCILVCILILLYVEYKKVVGVIKEINYIFILQK